MGWGSKMRESVTIYLEPQSTSKTTKERPSSNCEGQFRGGRGRCAHREWLRTRLVLTCWWQTLFPGEAKSNGKVRKKGEGRDGRPEGTTRVMGNIYRN